MWQCFISEVHCFPEVLHVCVDSVMRRYKWFGEDIYRVSSNAGGVVEASPQWPRVPCNSPPSHEYIVKSEFPTNQVHN